MLKYLSALCTTFCLALSTSAFAGEPSYAIIIDAGSSGSRIHLFNYDKTTPVPVIEDVFSESIKPGLSAFATDPSTAGASLKKLLDDAITQLQTANVDPQTASISVLATAGMRLVPEATQTQIYASVNAYLKQHYAFQIKQVATISGQMEGLYGWLDVNYLAKTFQQHLPTVGSIDMGGASTQLVFAVTQPGLYTDEMQVTLDGTVYTVFAKSFLGLGLDQALAAINKSMHAATCYPLNYAINAELGKFHLGLCQLNYHFVLNNQHHIKDGLPSLAGKNFIAYSGAYYTYHFLDLDQTTTAKTVNRRIASVCTKSWDDLKAAYPHEAEKYLATYCANGSYLSELFYETYQLQDGQLQVANKIDNHDIDWTLGALLYQLL